MKKIFIFAFLMLFPTLAWGAVPVISNVTENSDPVNCYEKYELTFDLTGTFDNPYEVYVEDGSQPENVTPEEGVTVTCTMTGPDSVAYDVPGFYYRDMEVSGTFPQSNYHLTEKLDDDSFKIRFKPDKVGTWQYSIVAEDVGGTSSAATGSFEARAPTKKGFIQVATDTRYFEYSGSGDIFWPIGGADMETSTGYTSFDGKGANIHRQWMGPEAAYCNQWADYIRVDKSSGNEGFEMPLDFEEAYTDMELSWYITVTDGACGIWTGPWENTRYSHDFVDYGGPEDTFPDYQMTVIYKIVGLVGPVDIGEDHGFTLKTHGFPAGDDKCDYTGAFFYESIRGNNTLGGFGHEIATTDWDSTVVTFDHQVADGTTYGDYLSFYLDNCSYGEVWIAKLSIKADTDDDGVYDQEIMRYESADRHRVIEQKPSFFFDKQVEAAEAAGVKLQYVIFEKNDWVPRHLDEDDGSWTDTGDGYNQALTTKSKWHIQMWWRYCVARWGYSTAVFLWEFCNEHHPNDADWYSAADDFAVYMKSIDSAANVHLLGTSVWEVTYWRQTDYDNNVASINLDVVNIHEYTDEADDKCTINSICGSDLYDWSISWSLDILDDQISKPFIMSESGIDPAATGDDRGDWLDGNANDGVWLHNLVWGGGLHHQPFYMGAYWWREHLDKVSGGYLPILAAFYNFVEDLDVHHGGYVAIDADDPAGIDSIGQKNVTKGKAYIHAQNDDYGWCLHEGAQEGAVDCSAGITPTNPNNLTFTMTGMADTDFILEEWDTDTGLINSTDVIESNGDALITIPIAATSDDVAYKIYLPEWPTRGGSMDRHYFVPYDLELDSGVLNLRWRRFLGERIEIEAEPVVVGDVVYIGLMNGKVYALDTSDGTTDWSYPCGGALPSALTVDRDKDNNLRILAASTDGYLYCLSDAGNLIWSADTGDSLWVTPAVHNNKVFVGNIGGNFKAYDFSTGVLLWTYPADSPISCTAAIGEVETTPIESAIFFQSGANTAYALRENGTELWTATMKGVFTKRTMAVYGKGDGGTKVVIFVTRKPGNDYSFVGENAPNALLYDTEPVGYKAIATVLSEYNTYYTAYGERRPLFYFNATDGTDLWSGSAYTPLYLGYWGLYTPVISNDGYAYFVPYGGAYTDPLDHDDRLVKVDLDDGSCIQIADEDDSPTFVMRPDEIGRYTLVNDRFYQTLSEDIGYYDIETPALNTTVYGDGFGTHRKPLLIDSTPTTIYPDGMHKFFTRFGCSTTGGIGGANDSVSPVVVAGNEVFWVSWGHLFCLTHESPEASNTYDPLDLFVAPPDLGLSRNNVKTLLNAVVQDIVDDDAHLDPATQMFWAQSSTAPEEVFWKDGEVLRTLSDALPYLEEPLKANTILYLSNLVDTYILDSNLYAYVWGCLDYDTHSLETTCNNTSPYRRWRWSNRNDIADRIYGLYKYCQRSDDWAKLDEALGGGDVWDFVVDTMYALFDNDANHTWEADSGFFEWVTWTSGNFHPVKQVAAMYAMIEMANYRGDAATEAEVQGYYDDMITAWFTTCNDAATGWVNFARAAHPGTDDNYTDWEDWGYSQGLSPMPAEGNLTATNDFRQVHDIDSTQSYSSWVAKAPFRLHGFDPIIPELGATIQSNASDIVSDFMASVEKYNPWWYMGDFSHAVIVGSNEIDSSSPALAADMFQAKIYIQDELFEDMVNYLPWKFEDYDYKDMFYIQNLTALLGADYEDTVVMILTP